MRARVFSILGVIFSVLPPLFATVEYFPIWVERGSAATLSGIAFLLLLLSLFPLARLLRRRRLPSMPLLWGLLWLLLTVLRRIIDGVIAVAFFGMLGNLCGALFFRLARGIEGGERNERA